MMFEEELDSIRRRIDCPVEWCSGRWIEHGGDGAAPDEWVHSDDRGVELGCGATLLRDQLGAGPVTWMLHAEHDGQRFAFTTATSPGEIARTLRDLADRIDESVGG